MNAARRWLGWGLVGALAALSLAATPAMACKGANSLLRDDFQDEDPAWGLSEQTAAKLDGGSLNFTTAPDYSQYLFYAGQNFPAADACVDVVFPSTLSKAFIQAGMGFWSGRLLYFAVIQPDGQAGVRGLQNGNWTTPVPVRKTDLVKTGPGAVNQVRLVWKGPPASDSAASSDPTVQFYINGQLFIKFKVPPNEEREFALFAITQGLTLSFKNLNITQ